MVSFHGNEPVSSEVRLEEDTNLCAAKALTLPGERRRLLNTFTTWLFFVCLLYSGNLSRVKTFANFCGFGAICESFNRKNFHRVRWRYYQWACHCCFPQFAKVLIANIRPSAIRKSFHPQKIPTIRYFVIFHLFCSSCIFYGLIYSSPLCFRWCHSVCSGLCWWTAKALCDQC